MKFVYTSETTVDDVIEHILMRLNTDFVGCCLQVPDFCAAIDYDYDSRMELKIRNRMFKHDVVERCKGIGQLDTAITLTAKGIEVFDNGGWKKYLAEYDAENEIKHVRENQPIIYVSGNVIIGNNNSEIIQRR